MRFRRFLVPLLSAMLVGCGVTGGPHATLVVNPITAHTHYGLMDMTSGSTFALAAGGGQNDALKFSGHQNTILGDIASNGGIQLGSNTQKCGSQYPNVNPGGPSGDCQNNHVCYPIMLSPQDIQDFIAQAQSNGTLQANVSGNLHLEQFLVGNTLPAGTYVATGQISLDKPNIVANGVTLIAGSIHITNKGDVFTAGMCDLLFYVSDCHGAPMYVSGSGNTFNGVIDVPFASFHVSGSGNTFNGNLQALTFQISGSNNTFNAGCP